MDLPGTKYVVGDGPDLDMLRRKYPEARFTGFRQGRELADHLAAADVFVFPSRTDTFGLVMLEAMACGVPVAAFPVTGPIDVVRNGETGVLGDNLRQAALSALRLDGRICRDSALAHSWQQATESFAAHLVDNRASPAQAIELKEYSRPSETRQLSFLGPAWQSKRLKIKKGLEGLECNKTLGLTRWVTCHCC